MHFEMSEALIDSILFSMEDQQGLFYVDAREGTVVRFEAPPDISYNGDGEDTRYYPIPEWESSDGYRLMERFAAAFRNPVIREKLTAALDQGKGVFRAFKNVLSEYPESERLWFSYKAREMRKELFRWYNGLREEWGIERIGEEPEETEDLVFEDFRIRVSLEKDREAMEKLHLLCREEYLKYLDKQGSGNIKEAILTLKKSSSPSSGDISFTAETAGGDFAGCISAAPESSGLRVTALEVRPEYRGLGLGESLLHHFLKSLDRRSVNHVIIDLPGGLEGFARFLLRESFQAFETRYYINLKKMS
ncbi:GNAT family N-acetyltransferase [Treponema sp. OttesenSCG-928-L16]|nr:GNAT family N-acetyltransferase [Treponema sp. OttesenSCG-928-L16]